jgi:hypothetical protein
MIKVLPIQTKEEQQRICALCGVEFNADMLAYAASVDDRLAGVCQFKLTDKGGIVTDIAATLDHCDNEALFVMGRGTLNFIDICGVHNAFFDADYNDEGIIKAIGFNKNDNGRYEVNLIGFFDEPCKKNK